MSDNKCVHTEHCCQRHGCKYGNKDCPVESGEKPQSFDCEYCEDDPKPTLSDLKEALTEHGMVAVSKHYLELVAVGYKATTEVPRYRRIAESLIKVARGG